MAKQEAKKETKKKKFLKSISFKGLPVAKVGTEVTGPYIKAVAELSKEDQSKYVG